MVIGTIVGSMKKGKCTVGTVETKNIDMKNGLRYVITPMLIQHLLCSISESKRKGPAQGGQETAAASQEGIESTKNIQDLQTEIGKLKVTKNNSEEKKKWWSS